MIDPNSRKTLDALWALCKAVANGGAWMAEVHRWIETVEGKQLSPTTMECPKLPTDEPVLETHLLMGCCIIVTENHTFVWGPEKAMDRIVSIRRPDKQADIIPRRQKKWVEPTE